MSSRDTEGTRPRNAVVRLIGWLRQGYPEGVPQSDYVALFGILHRDLTTAEIEHVVHTLRSDPAFPRNTAIIPEDRVREAIEGLVKERASATDIERVTARLQVAATAVAAKEGAEELSLKVALEISDETVRDPAAEPAARPTAPTNASNQHQNGSGGPAQP